MNQLKVWISIVALVFIAFSCDKDEVEGVSNAELKQEFVYGGWEFDEFECQLKYNTANPLAVVLPSLRKTLLETIEERIGGGVLYFKDSIVYFAEYIEGEEGVIEYYKGSYYEWIQNPSQIHLSNATLLSGAYTPILYAKQEGDRLCLYLTRELTMDLIRQEGTIDEKYVDIMDSNIDDAQFEFYLRRAEIPFFDNLIE